MMGWEGNGQSFLVRQVSGICDLNRGRIEVGWRLGGLRLEVLKIERRKIQVSSAESKEPREQEREGKRPTFVDLERLRTLGAGALAPPSKT